jgi:hypothetical protein
MSTTSQAPVADEPETRPESPATTDPSDPALKHLPKTTRTDKVSLDLDVKHSKENLQTVIEEYMSLCHRCPKRANGQPVYGTFFVYSLGVSVDKSMEGLFPFVQAAYGETSTPLCPGTRPESTTTTERKEGQWGFEIAGPPPKMRSKYFERLEKELNSLGWHRRKSSTDPSDNFYQEFSEAQVLRGDAAANIMDVFSRNEFITAFMARVQIEAGVELIRLTEKDFEGGRIRRPEPSEDHTDSRAASIVVATWILGYAFSLLVGFGFLSSVGYVVCLVVTYMSIAKVSPVHLVDADTPLRWTVAIGGSAFFWYVVVSSGLISVLPWWIIFFLGFFTLGLLLWPVDAPRGDASRTPESSQRRRQAIPEQVRHAVWRRDEGRCVECGSKEKLEYDHIIPWSKGGSDTERNLQLLCETCNRQKGASI